MGYAQQKMGLNLNMADGMHLVDDLDDWTRPHGHRHLLVDHAGDLPIHILVVIGPVNGSAGDMKDRAYILRLEICDQLAGLFGRNSNDVDVST